VVRAQRTSSVAALPRSTKSRACSAGRAFLCDDEPMAVDRVEVRLAEERDRLPLAQLFAAVAEERDGIASEPPVDVKRRAAVWRLERTLVARAGEEIVGELHLDTSQFGFGEIGMMVAREWRGRGVGSALMAAAIEWGREHGLHSSR
jgi:GNAT superfamily N-acetyltransferase